MPEKLKVKTRKLTSKNNRSQWSGHSLCIDGQVRLMSGKQPCLRKTGKVKAMYQEKMECRMWVKWTLKTEQTATGRGDEACLNFYIYFIVGALNY